VPSACVQTQPADIIDLESQALTTRLPHLLTLPLETIITLFFLTITKEKTLLYFDNSLTTTIKKNTVTRKENLNVDNSELEGLK